MPASLGPLSTDCLAGRAEAKNPEEENSVVEAYFQCCADTDADRALVDMLDQVRSGWGCYAHTAGQGGLGWGWGVQTRQHHV